MAKRHVSQSQKQALGQFYTTNSDYILAGYEELVKDKIVVDPFAGGGDLLEWSIRNGAKSVVAYDLQPNYPNTIQNDSLNNPPSYKDMMVVTNPPYLAKNKCKGDKSVYDKWEQNDYYKCHLASLAIDCEEAIEVLPSNFFCESRAGIRNKLFETHHIVSAKYWNTPVFDDATTGICVIHLKRGSRDIQQFPMSLSSGETVDVVLKAENNFLYGEKFFLDINRAKGINIVKTDVGMPPPNTNLVVGLLDNGKWSNGVKYNTGDAIYCSPKSFTTYQITLPDHTITESDQKRIADEFQKRMTEYRHLYHDLFLANYMGPTQKILSRHYVHSLLETVMMDLDIIPAPSLEKLFA